MEPDPYNVRWRSACTPMPLSILTAPTDIPSSVFPIVGEGIVHWWKFFTTWGAWGRFSFLTSSQKLGAESSEHQSLVLLGQIVGMVIAMAGSAITFRLETPPRLNHAESMENRPRENNDWIVDLSARGDAQDSALEDLRKLLISGLAKSFPQQGAAFIEDITQVALLRVLKNLNSFAGKSKFTTWAMAIAMRIALSDLRKGRWRHISLDEMTESGGSEDFVDSSSADPGFISSQNSIISVLHELVTNILTEKQRMAILAELNGVPLEEIAVKLGNNLNATYKLLHDARKRLKAALEASSIYKEDVAQAFSNR